MALDLGANDPSEIYGKTDVELFGEELGNRTLIEDKEVMEQGIPKVGLIEKYINKKGDVNWTSTTKLPLKDANGTIIGLLGITREINDIKSSEMGFQWLATHDLLTGLPNRFLLLDHIEQAIFHEDRSKNLFALLFIDLNGFKKINDNAGHKKGDEFLKTVALILTEKVRLSDTVARIGGDEFVVLLEGLITPENSKAIALKLADAIMMNVDHENHSVTASIGISLFPTNGKDAETLLKEADRAMYEAKRSNIPYRLA